MATTIYAPSSVGLVKSLEEEQPNHKKAHDLLLWKENVRNLSPMWDNSAGPAYPHKATKNSLWIDASYHPLWFVEELCRRGLPLPSQAQYAELCKKNEKLSPLCNHEIAAFVASLRACAKSKDLHKGTKLHDEISKRGLLEACSDDLVTMYAKCGALAKAKELLDIYKSRDVFSWTALIAGHARHGHSQDALNCFGEMKREGLSPDAVTFACILKACGSIKAVNKGEQIHDEIARQGLLGNDFVLGTALVDMYAKCGALAKAQHVLEELPSQDVVSWNALIAGYAQHGQGEQALSCFEQMQNQGFSPNAVTFTCILKACGTIGAAGKGEQIHDEISRQGLLDGNVVLGTAVVDMYAKCGALQKAHQVLEKLPFRDVVSWNALIAGYAQQGQGEQALTCFERMQQEGLSPNAATFACALKACGNIGAADKGEQIHDEIIRQGLLGTNIVLDSALVDMYAKSDALAKAQRVLEELPFWNVASWNSLISGYVQQGEAEQALNCFEQMQGEGLSPDVVTVTSILKACGIIGAVNKGEQIHDKIARRGLLEKDILLGTALVDMYAKCGALEKAQKVLEELPSRDAVSWNALIAGYAQHNLGEQALKCYERMQHEKLSPDVVTFICILKACGSIKSVVRGEHIHDEIARQGFLGSNIALGSALVDMYAKCGALAKAQRVLEKLPSRNVVSWSSLIVGYAQQGEGEQALNCFERMVGEGLSPDAVTYASILKACGTIGAADKGKQIHDKIARQGLLGNDTVLCTALVDMYAKCGALAKAQGLLEELPYQDVVSWNTLIAGYVQQGQGEQALSCFMQMQHKGFSPNAVTFSCVLNGCSHLGRVEDGYTYFVNMSTRYGIEPDLEHYTCMIDLLGRAGHFGKAVSMIQEMPFYDCSVLCALLGACRIWGDVDVGRWAFEEAVQVDKSDGAAYLLMADIYAAAGMQEAAKNIEAMREENRAWKMPGRRRWIDTSGNVHAFFVGNTKHANVSTG